MNTHWKSIAVRAAAVVASGLLVAGAALPASAVKPDGLRADAPKDLKIGAAVWGAKELVGYDPKSPTEFQRVLASEYSSLTPENDMKWDSIHPAPGVYNFSGGDLVVSFAKANHQVVRGHTLLWHSQNPQWVTDASKTWTCTEARLVLKDHIDTVVGHYKGQIQQWDVANEIFQDTWDQGGVRLRTDKNPFLKACSQDPVALIGDAFRWAHAADPGAVLFLNDYNVEGINAKTNAYYALAKELLADGVPLQGFGLQAHLSLAYGFDDSLQANMQRFADLGLEISLTEVDVRVPLGEDGEPSQQQVAEQADRYQRLLGACLAVEQCQSFTIWGVDDSRSWVPDVFAGEGYALPMTGDFARKPAYQVMRQLLHDATPGNSPRVAPGQRKAK